MLAEIEHRGHLIKKNLDSRRGVRKSRRQRKTRYRPVRFLNRTKPEGWLAPSVKSRANNVINFIKKYKKLINITNLAASCRTCNQMKSNLTLKAFGKLVGKDFSHLKPKKLPRYAAIVQSARNYMVKEITKLVSDTTTYDAWLTKYNRDELALPKEHYYDALSVGEIPTKFNFFTDKILQISAKGRGSRQMCLMNKFGFPRTSPKGSKLVEGFQTGDIVKAIVPTGLKKGEYLGRVAVRSRGYFNIQTKTQVVQGIGFEYCHIIQRSDGYSYNYKERI